MIVFIFVSGLAKLHRPVLVDIANRNMNENQFQNYIINDVRNIKNVPFEVAGSIAEMTKRQHECPLWGHLRRNRITASKFGRILKAL